MASLMETLGKTLAGGALKQMSRQLGSDEKATGSAVAAALPMIIGALARNASKKEGAEALEGALARDHDGGILDDITGFLGGAESGPGDGILRHVLGARRPAVESGVSKASGLDGGSVAKMMVMLAPIVMGALGKQKREKGMDSNALSGFLGDEGREVERLAPGSMGVLGTLLDADGDGDVDLGDIAKRGFGIFGKLMGGK